MSGTGGSLVTVNSGGTLSGIGTIIPAQTLESRNTVTIKSGGTPAPGNSPCILTIGSVTTPGITTATVSFESGARFKFQYTGTPAPAAPDSGASPAPGASGDSMVTVNGALNHSGTVFVGDSREWPGRAIRLSPRQPPGCRGYRALAFTCAPEAARENVRTLSGAHFGAQTGIYQLPTAAPAAVG